MVMIHPLGHGFRNSQFFVNELAALFSVVGRTTDPWLYGPDGVKRPKHQAESLNNVVILRRGFNEGPDLSFYRRTVKISASFIVFQAQLAQQSNWPIRPGPNRFNGTKQP